MPDREYAPKGWFLAGFPANNFQRYYRSIGMKLSVVERVLVQGLLPEKGTFTNLKLIRKAKEALSFTEEEHKLLNFQQNGDQLTWNEGSVGEVDIELGEIVTEMVKKELKKRDEKEELLPQQESIYSKFIEAS